MSAPLFLSAARSDTIFDARCAVEAMVMRRIHALVTTSGGASPPKDTSTAPTAPWRRTPAPRRGLYTASDVWMLPMAWHGVLGQVLHVTLHEHYYRRQRVLATYSACGGGHDGTRQRSAACNVYLARPVPLPRLEPTKPRCRHLVAATLWRMNWALVERKSAQQHARVLRARRR